MKAKKRSKIRNIITIISDIMFITVLIMLIYLCLVVRKGEVPGAFGYKALRVVSSSMEPWLEKGDCILIKCIEPEEVQVGDIISFFSSDPVLEKYVNTHRVVSIEKDEDGKLVFTTKGDNNKYEDYYPALEDKFLGVYYKHLPFENAINKLFDILSDRVNYFFIMILPILFCLVESVISLINAVAALVADKKTVEKKETLDGGLLDDKQREERRKENT